MKRKPIKPIKRVYMFNGKTYVRYSHYIDQMEEILSSLPKTLADYDKILKST